MELLKPLIKFCCESRLLTCPATVLADGGQVLYFEQVPGFYFDTFRNFKSFFDVVDDVVIIFNFQFSEYEALTVL